MLPKSETNTPNVSTLCLKKLCYYARHGVLVSLFINQILKMLLWHEDTSAIKLVHGEKEHKMQRIKVCNCK